MNIFFRHYTGQKVPAPPGHAQRPRQVLAAADSPLGRQSAQLSAPRRVRQRREEGRPVRARQCQGFFS